MRLGVIVTQESCGVRVQRIREERGELLVRTRVRRRRGLLRLALVGLCSILAAWLMVPGGGLAPARALAENPFRVGSQIEDRAGVLGNQVGQVKTALSDLQTNEHVQLWVVFVDTFSGLASQDWANQTATLSNLGLNDVLLAVAVTDRAYAYMVDQDFPLSTSQLNQIMVNLVEPALSANNWAGAAIAAADGIGQALAGGSATSVSTTSGATAGGAPTTQPATSPASGGGAPWGLIAGLIVLAAIVLIIVMVVVRSRRGRAAKGAPPAGEGAAQPVPAAPLESIKELRQRVSAHLVQTDDALKTSTDEVGFAAAEFGDAEAAPFQQALDGSRAELDQAFRLYRQFSDAADEQAQRQLLAEVLKHTDAANAQLDAQVEHFDKLRDLEARAPQVLSGVEEQLGSIEAKLPDVRKQLESLASVYAAEALKSVTDNPDEAMSRITFAREQVKAGRTDVEVLLWAALNPGSGQRLPSLPFMRKAFTGSCPARRSRTRWVLPWTSRCWASGRCTPCSARISRIRPAPRRSRRTTWAC